jgi:hypothetical protein
MKTSFFNRLLGRRYVENRRGWAGDALDQIQSLRRRRW